MSRKHQGRRTFRPRVEALERRELLTAGLQVVHNSPYSAAAVVDVYVNDALAIEDFAFREATPFLNLNSGVNLKIDIRGANAPSNSVPVFTTTVNLTDGQDYVAMAVGEPGSTFTIAVTDLGRRIADNPANAEFLVFHGAPDAPPVDVQARGVGTLVNDLSYEQFAPDYLSVPPDNYTVDITLADGLTRVAAFQADLSSAAGQALVVAASGFAVPPTANDPGFGLLAIFPDGTTSFLAPIPQVIEGTAWRDRFTVKAKDGDPAILQVIGPRWQVTQFLTATTPSVEIRGLGSHDSLTVHAPAGPNAVLPQIIFQGGSGYDSVHLYGTSGADTFVLDETTGVAIAINSIRVRAFDINAISICAGRGDDLIDAREVDTINMLHQGGDGNDTIYGGQAVDCIYGEHGNDTLYGNGGRDYIFGGYGDDQLWGGAGHDFMFGGSGRDQIEGRYRRFLYA